MSVELGGIRESTKKHLLYKACFFFYKSDRDAFLELCQEEFPFETFYIGDIDGVPAIQVSQK